MNFNKLFFAIVIFMFGLPLISGCSNDDDGTWCSDPAFVQDSE